MFVYVWRSIIALTLVWILVVGNQITSFAEEKNTHTYLRIVTDKSAISVFGHSQRILRYRFADVPKKPYVDWLCSPSGVQILRDSTPDHKHHHGLMYAVAVNNVSFWEESEKAGRQINRTLTILQPTIVQEMERAGFVEQLDWISPQNKNPLLVEQRTVEVLWKPELGATLINWRSCLQTPSIQRSVHITGNHYYGLGMRFVESMDKNGYFLRSDEKAPHQTVRGDEQIAPMKWCAYVGKVDDRPVTVAIFDHPGNFRHPAKIFTMSKPFAYLSATLDEWKNPFEIHSDNPLELCYGVVVWDGQTDKNTIEHFYQKWLKIPYKD